MARNILTRAIALIFIFDDIHDIYGILEELVPYARTIEKYTFEFDQSMCRETEEELQKRVVDAWKDINKEFLSLTASPTLVLTLFLNLSWVIDVLYTNGDCYTHSKTKLKEHVTSLFVSPFPI
ncbi:hypothetical protein EUGRSUZ_D01102 [Eucalyptus grandis]|uniref:Uncharacterized protein n=2 Tax=Eucalyptus grandis TaxID=71139 RepID=A0ACC3L5A7_EUCGR|nr:hypothetical protein EUGRSUZ_D01102 [Eucalyptus grandis]